MESHNEQHPTSRYKSYIKESSLPEDYVKRGIRFDTVNDPGGVPYKDNRYESVGDYRQKKQYPSKEIDKRQKESFDKFSAHGTSLASVISCLLYTNKQLVPAIKLRKLIGSSSSSGESKGFVDLTSNHFNNKFISAVTLDEQISENQKTGLYIALGYSTAFLSDKENSASNVPVLLFGNGVGKSLKIQSRAENEHAWQRMDIRLMAVKEEDKADVLAVLRALEIYDVKVCTLNQVNDLYLEAEENSSLKALWEKSESADPQIPLGVYEEEAEKIHQLHQVKIKETASHIVEKPVHTESPQAISEGTDSATLEKMEDLGKDTFQKIMASTESIQEPSTGTDNATLQEIEELGKDTLEKNKIYANTSQTIFKQKEPESTKVEEKEANLNPKGNVT